MARCPELTDSLGEEQAGEETGKQRDCESRPVGQGREVDEAEDEVDDRRGRCGDQPPEAGLEPAAADEGYDQTAKAPA